MDGKKWHEKEVQPFWTILFDQWTILND